MTSQYKIFNIAELNEQKMVIDKRKGEIRPTFYVQGNEVRSIGILFYRMKNNQVQFLLRREAEANQKEKQKYADLGGKTALTDKTIFETAQRKVLAESQNQLLGDKYVVNEDCFYNQECKYLMYMSKIEEFQVSQETAEQCVQNDEIQWLNAGDIDQLVEKKQLHVRLLGMWHLIKKIIWEKYM